LPFITPFRENKRVGTAYENLAERGNRNSVQMGSLQVRRST